MKKLLVLLVLLTILLASGAFWIIRWSGQRTEIAYTTLPAEFGPAVESVSATGFLQPRQVYIVGAEVSGRVVELAADFNQVVEEGAVLLRIDDRADRLRLRQAELAVRAAKEAVKQAEAARDSARTILRRERQLPIEIRREINVEVAEHQFRAAEATVAGARVKVEQAERDRALAALRLDLATVRAPTPRSDPSPSVGRPAGKLVVLDRKVSLNQVIGPPLSAHLFTLAGDLDVLDVEAQVAEGDVGKVTLGQQAELIVSAVEGDGLLRGKVVEIRPLPIGEHGAVFYKVILELPNVRDPAGGWRLRPGLTATVDIIRRRHERTWKIPTAALSFQPDEAQLAPEALATLRQWESSGDREHWRVVCVVRAGRPWPVFVRIGGTDAQGETGIRDASFTEVLEWGAEVSPQPEAGKPSTYPRLIIGAPPVKSGPLDGSPIKL